MSHINFFLFLDSFSWYIKKQLNIKETALNYKIFATNNIRIGTFILLKLLDTFSHTNK